MQWTQICLSVAAGALSCIGLVVCGLAFRRRTGRRLVMGVGFIGLGAAAGLLAFGAPLIFTRSYVVVYGSECSSQDLEKVLRMLDAKSKVALVRLGDQPGDAAGEPWDTAGNWAAAAGQGELTPKSDSANAHRVTTISWSDPNWAQSVLAAAHRLHDLRGRFEPLIHQQTVLVIHDEKQKWSELPVTAVPVSALVHELARKDRNLFVVQAPSMTVSGKLELTVLGTPVPSQFLSEYLQQIQLRLLNYPTAGDVKGKLSLAIDEPVPASAPGESVPGGAANPTTEPARQAFGNLVQFDVKLQKTEETADGVPQAFVQLSEILASPGNSSRLQPGFHKLTGVLTIAGVNGTPSDSFPAAVYFEVADSQIVIFQPPGGLGKNLADFEWDRYRFKPVTDENPPTTRPTAPTSGPAAPGTQPTTRPASVDQFFTGGDVNAAKSGEGFLLNIFKMGQRSRAYQVDRNRGIAPLANYRILPRTSLGTPAVALIRTTVMNQAAEDLKKLDALPAPATQAISDGGDQAAMEAAQSPDPVKNMRGIRNQLTRSRALVLIEPSLTQLIYLDKLLGLPDRIRNGLNVLVIGPPPYELDANWPKWLPWSAAPIPQTQPSDPIESLRVFRDTRVYFCTDNSRRMMPRHGERESDVYRPLHAQRDIINSVYASLGAQVARDPDSKPLRLPQWCDIVDAQGSNKEKDSTRNDYHSALIGLDRLAFTPDDITIYPPATITLDSSLDHYTTGEPAGDIKDILPSHIGLRLQAITGSLTSEAMGDGWQPIISPHVHCNTFVVLFVVDRAQWVNPKELSVVVRSGTTLKANTSPQIKFSRDSSPYTVDQLVHMGVKVLAVKIRNRTIDEQMYIDAMKALLTSKDTTHVEDYQLVSLDTLLGVSSGDSSPRAGFINAPPNPVPADRGYVTQYNLKFDENPASGDEFTKEENVELAKSRKAQALSIAARIAEFIKKRDPGSMTRQRGGRVIDARVWPQTDPVPTTQPAVAPYEHVFLVDAPPATSAASGPAATLPVAPVLTETPFSPPYAFIDDGLKPFVKPAAAVLARDVGEGHVIVTNYSPFAEHVWDQDCGKSPWPYSDKPPQGERLQGWGPQRLIDTLYVSAYGRALPQRPMIRDLRVLQDGSTMMMLCWAGLPTPADPATGGAAGWPTPQVLDKDGNPHPFEITRIDALSRICEYRFAADMDWDGMYRLQLSPGDGPTQVFLSLKKRAGSSSDVMELLAGIARMSGGAPLNSRDAGAFSTGLEYARPFAWPLSFGMCGALLLMLMVGRRWSLLLFLRRRKQLKAARRGGLGAGELDVNALVMEWGLNPGPPRTGRQAGLPGGERRYATGDHLSSARPATLFPFTAINEVIRLPVQKPLVRLRHVGSSVEATLLVDCSPSLSVPDRSRYVPKTKFAEDLIVVFAETMWQRGGTVTLASLQMPATPHADWISTGPGDTDALRKAVRQLRKGAGWHTYLFAALMNAINMGAGNRRPKQAVEPGAVVFIVTDLLGIEDRHLIDVLSRLNQEGASVRVAHISDPDERDLVGLRLDVNSGSMQDRTEWEPREIDALNRSRAARFNYLVRREDGRFVSLTTDLSSSAVGERLLESDFLS